MAEKGETYEEMGEIRLEIKLCSFHKQGQIQQICRSDKNKFQHKI